MAKSPIPLLLFTFALAGCQSNQLVEQIPPPSFSGPGIQSNAARSQVAQPWAPQKLPAPPNTGVPREWSPLAAARPWKWIVIHHSATPSGSARTFDRMHREKGWDELGYHFVIGNGTDTPDGKIEVGPRWPKQKWGAHAKTPNNEFNDYGIGICLVGNFDVERPTQAQMNSLARLTAYLMKNYRIPASRVLGHNGTGKPTDCPGRNMNIASIRKMAAQMVAESDDPSADSLRTASTE